MKINQLVETENVKNANRVLKNLLDRTRTENVGIGLFYGMAGVGKTRWAMKTAHENGYIYHRLEINVIAKDFIYDIASKLLAKIMPNYEVRGTKIELYHQTLDILQKNYDTTIILDEIDYGFRNNSILPTIRDWADQSLATFVLVGMDRAKEQMLKLNSHYFDRCNCFYEFKPLNLADTEKMINETCDVVLCKEIIQFIHNKCHGTIRIVNKYIDACERISKRMKINELKYADIKDILSTVEVR